MCNNCDDCEVICEECQDQLEYQAKVVDALVQLMDADIFFTDLIHGMVEILEVWEEEAIADGTDNGLLRGDIEILMDAHDKLCDNHEFYTEITMPGNTKLN